MSHICIVDGCSTYASYGQLGRKALHCKLHKLDNEIFLKCKYCVVHGCSSRAYYGTPDVPSVLRCTDHKLDTDVNHSVSNKCKSVDCNKAAAYAATTDVKALYCYLHKRPLDVYYGIHKCSVQGCSALAKYITTDKTKKYCVDHVDRSVDECVKYMKHNQCTNGNCTVFPSYRTIGVDGKRCLTHRLPTDTQANSKICEFDRCTMIAYYGTDKKAIHCRTHRTQSEYNVTKPVCSVLHCTQLAYYTTLDNSLYCTMHVPDNSDTLKLRESSYKASSKTVCNVSGCSVRASYGILDDTPMHCSRHKTPNEVRILKADIKKNNRTTLVEASKLTSSKG